MSIVKMQRLRLIALAQDRDALLDRLLHIGCVELSEPSAYLADEDWAQLLHRDAGCLPELRGQANEFRQALDVLAKHAPYKGGMFAARGTIKESDLLDENAVRAALEKAREINARARELGQLAARETRLKAEELSLRPWENYDLPLEEKGTRMVAVLLGSVPSTVDVSALGGAVTEAADAEVKLLSSGAEQHCLEILVHRSSEQAALETLRGFGFSFAQIKDLKGTVKENIQALEVEHRKLQDQRQKEEEAIRALGGAREELQICVDRLRQYESKEDAKERLLTGGSIIYLDGWTPVEETEALKKALAKFDCAWELTDPTPEEYPEVPIKLKNNIFTRCMNTVTEMYSLPAYDGVDPNPLMAPFFILFFGMMMADMGYGILMILGTQFVLKKTKPKNPHFMELFFWCGVSTLIIGAMTGGFFGDFIPKIVEMFNPASTFLKANGGCDWFYKPLFTPLDDTVAIMVGSMALGLVQIFTGMTVSVVKKCQEGEFIDALFSEITWWIILGGLALFVCGMMLPAAPAVLGTVGKAALIVGALMLAFGGTRNAKGFGKVTSLVGLVYNGVTGYFSDTLSYIRIMALMLAGSVIASVFNTLGATFGNVILFVIISMIGNALNLALNLLGCYVHDLRLQCLEFFGRFYKEGGKPYQPLAIQTNYVDVIKED